MVHTVALLLLLAVFAPLASSFSVIGYIPEYRVDHVKKHLALFAKHLDEAILFSVHVLPSGELGFSPEHPGLHRDQVTGFVAEAKDAGVSRVLLSVGGGGRSDGFQAVTAQPESRASFARALVETCREYQLDGIDLDWEGISSQEQMANYEATIEVIGEAFAPLSLRLSVALHYWQHLQPHTLQFVDHVNLMAYDILHKNAVGHATMQDTKSTVQMMTARGTHTNKIALGVPAYARQIKNPAEVLTFGEIVSKYHPESSRDTDKHGEWWFNGVDTVRAKTSWAMDRGLAGIMVWEVGQDSTEEHTSLVAAIAQERDAREQNSEL